MTSDFVPELAKYSKSRPNPQIAQNEDLANDARYALKFRRPYRKSGSLSKNMMSDFAPELPKYPKGAANPKIVQNSVQTYCLALLSNAASFYRYP